MKFKLTSTYKPTGDQPQAIAKLVQGINKGYQNQTLLGVTGSGKTFTVANVIEKIQQPTLVFPITKHWLPSFIRNSVNFSPKMPLLTLFPITITINPRPICPRPIPI